MSKTLACWAGLALAVLVGAGCDSTPRAAPVDEPDAARSASDPAVAPTDSRVIADDILLDLSRIREIEYTSGEELGTTKPKETPASRYADGRMLFAYDLKQIGARAGHELIVVMMNVRTGDRLPVPHARARVAFLTADERDRHVIAESGYITIEEANEERLVGSFEVRFDELNATVVRGRFDSTITPAVSTE